MLRVVGCLPLILSIAGCATITQGTDQTLAVNSQPPGAACTLTREGAVIAEVANTPGSVSVSKSTHGIVVDCDKPGYFGSTVLKSELNAATAGNVVIGGLIGIAVDAASGAMHKYPQSVLVPLQQIEKSEKRKPKRKRRRKPDGRPVS